MNVQQANSKTLTKMEALTALTLPTLPENIKSILQKRIENDNFTVETVKDNSPIKISPDALPTLTKFPQGISKEAYELLDFCFEIKGTKKTPLKKETIKGEYPITGAEIQERFEKSKNSESKMSQKYHAGIYNDAVSKCNGTLEMERTFLVPTKTEIKELNSVQYTIGKPEKKDGTKNSYFMDNETFMLKVANNYDGKTDLHILLGLEKPENK